ncbi:MAG: hypothetical protein II367_00055, partial [Treponema sp.]|nr:hypothetical protein [Treponema sp.]
CRPNEKGIPMVQETNTSANLQIIAWNLVIHCRNREICQKNMQKTFTSAKIFLETQGSSVV